MRCKPFSLAEVAYFPGVTPSNVKKLHLEGKGPTPATTPAGRRTYSAEQMLELRAYLDRHGRTGVKTYVPHRRAGEAMQILSVVNFKGGSGKTTKAAHLAQFLALTGHRVLAIDLDPQASLSALHGVQPELDRNPSLYDAIRYDEHRLNWFRYLVTRYEPTDGPQSQMVGFMQALFPGQMLKSTAIADAGITNQTLYEVDRAQFNRATYDRAWDAMNAVNEEVASLLRRAWGRRP
jgi:hypothetical protein